MATTCTTRVEPTQRPARIYRPFLLTVAYGCLLLAGVFLLKLPSTSLATSPDPAGTTRAAAKPALKDDGIILPSESNTAAHPPAVLLTGSFGGQPPRYVPPSVAPAAVVQAPAVFPATGGGVLHTVTPGQNLPSLVRIYLPQTSFMTGSELEIAIRAANGDRKGLALKPGEQIVIPGYESGVVEHPIPRPKDAEIRAIYLTGTMAGSARGLELIRRWHALGGNAVVFDIKDSDGLVNVPFQHALAPNRTPAIRNLPKFIRYLHNMQMHSIARIAVFRDEYLVQHHPELAVRSRRSGEPWQENGKLVWTDPSRLEVQQYNIALARFAAHSGVDEVQFDYVRFPAEGDQKDAQFAFEKAHPKWQRTDVITDFLAQAYAELKPLRVLFSLDVFGVMAWQRPVDLSHTGQDIVSMAWHCDVLSPMIYPSHFFGMDGYSEPGDAPEHFIAESMDRFRDITKGSGVVLRPWLQAFGWRTRTYSPEYILKQVSVARQRGGIGFLFWNARNDYSKPFAAMPEMTAHPERYLQTARPEQAPAKTQPLGNGPQPLASTATPSS